MTKSKLMFIKKEGGALPESEVIDTFVNSTDLEKIKRAVEQAEDRLYVTWATVDVRDSQGEIVPIEEVINEEDTYLERGGSITDTHSNNVIGKVLAYKVMMHPKANKIGVLHLAKIYNHNKLDDKVWTETVNGERYGSSIGGFSTNDYYAVEPDTGMKTKVRSGFAHTETANVLGDPANPFATNEAFSLVAKSYNKVSKPFGPWENYDSCVQDLMDRQGYDQETAEAACARIHRNITGKWPVDNSKNKNSESLKKKENTEEITKTNKGDLIMDEKVDKRFSNLEKSVSEITTLVKSLVDVKKQEEEPEEDKDMEDKEAKKVKKQEEEKDQPKDSKEDNKVEKEDVSGKIEAESKNETQPEESFADDANDYTVMKTEISEMKKMLKEMNSVKKQSARPSGSEQGNQSGDKLSAVKKQQELTDVAKNVASGKQAVNINQIHKMAREQTGGKPLFFSNM
jgi:hypothetical protein